MVVGLVALFHKQRGNVTSMNAQGESVLRNILSHPEATNATRHHARFGNIMEIKTPNGQEARFSEDGTVFHGLIE